MLYVSTRNRTDSYTAHRALHEASAPDGGMFVPFQLPEFQSEDLSSFRSRTFCDNVAYILNLFFSSHLTSWDVEMSVGRYPAQLTTLPRKLMIAELWHNLPASFSQMESALYARLCGNHSVEYVPNWVKIAIRIAMLFAIYGEIDPNDPGRKIDLAVEARFFIAPVAAWYARKMGLPIGKIICAGYENSDVWDLLHRGELNCASMQVDSVGIERLIYHTVGQEEAARFADSCKARKLYAIDEEQLAILSDGLFAAVVSKDRIQSTINSFYRSNDYIPDTVAAISYGALQDYRAKTGESCQTLIFSLSSPANHKDELSRILGLPASLIENKVNHRKG